MKSISIIILLMAAFSLQAGSLECSIYKNDKNQSELIQTSFAKDDPEEESELYELSYDNNTVKATVINLPYQNGVDLYLESSKLGIRVNANFDQENDEDMNLDLNIDKISYTLACFRK